MMIIILCLLGLFLLNTHYILKCNKLSKENMKLLMENMAIHELYLNKTKCQCKKDDLPIAGSYNTGIGCKLLANPNTDVIKNKFIGNI